MAGLLAKTEGAVVNALQCAVHFEELVGFVAEFGPEQITVRLFLRGVGDIAAQHVCGGCGLRCMLGMGAHQAITEVNQGAMVPRPLGRNLCVAGRIRGVALRFSCFRRWARARLG
jgi:hypothetical protein